MDEPVDALRRMQAAVVKAQRTASVQFPLGFVRSPSGDPVLARLMRGGRGGGEVRLRLYLTLRMQATAPPFRLPGRTSSSLAGLLNLSPIKGPRRVTDALHWLEENKLLTKSPVQGKPASLTLLKPDGSGDPLSDRWERRYLTLPIELWTLGWILRMSGRSLAVYTALTELTGGKDQEGAVMPGERKAEYGMSDDTWTRACRELRDMGVLVTDFEKYGDDEHDIRRRQRYWLRKLADVGGPTWSS